MVRIRPNLSNVRRLGTEKGASDALNMYFKRQEAAEALKAQQAFTLSRDEASRDFTRTENEKTMAFNREKFQEETRQFGIKNAIERRNTVYGEAAKLAANHNISHRDIKSFVEGSGVNLNPRRMNMLFAINEGAGAAKLEERVKIWLM